jgi:hypothetical protein
MILVNEKVEHINYGLGVITEVKENKIWVQFTDVLGTKIFLYPEGFEKFLKAMNPTVENNVLEDLYIRQEKLQLERKEKEREAAELEEIRIAELIPVKKKSAARSTKRKS